MTNTMRGTAAAAWWGLPSQRGTAGLLLPGAAIALAAALAAVSFAAFWPAWRASRLPPAALLAA